MGRELRRVPLDFAWPLKKVWEGFLNPYFKPCPEAAKNACIGGATPAGKWLDAVARLIALLGREAIENTPEHIAHFAKVGRIYPHPYLEEWSQAPRTDLPAEIHREIGAIEDRGERCRRLEQYLRKHPPQLLPLTDELAALVQSLAGEEKLSGSPGGMVDYALSKALKRAAGIDSDGPWGCCQTCGGEGMDPAVKDIYEAWNPTPPPAGEGWQLWETVSEGSPVSAVYRTRAEFVDYLVSEGYSKKAAENFCKMGWAPSGFSDGETFYANVAAAEIMGREE